MNNEDALHLGLKREGINNLIFSRYFAIARPTHIPIALSAKTVNFLKDKKDTVTEDAENLHLKNTLIF